jgi:hypothetical protein
MRETGSVELAPQAGLAAVLGRIERRDGWRRWILRPVAALFGDRGQRPLALAVAIQALVIVMLTGVLGIALRAPPEADYRTLSTTPVAPADGTRLRVVLAESLTLGEVRELLEPWGGRIVAGPEGRGIYTVSITAPADEALRGLRAHGGVLLAERIAGP